MTANLTVTDLFCGAGGSSSGAVQVPGVRVHMAANHWQLAIDSHNANHPDTLHDCADISQVDPRRYPTTDILWASPECTTHSRARGQKADRQPDLFGDLIPDAAVERSRVTMWDPIRFAERHRYRAIVIENVVEITKWLPFDAWISAWHALGYQHKIVSLNSMHAQAHGLPAPQSRDRIYVVLWRRGERAPDLAGMQRPVAWCPSCGDVVHSIQSWKNPSTVAGRYKAQYVYRCPRHSCRGQIVEPAWLPALSFLDLNNTGTRIGDRDRPLSDKTMRRIEHGARKFWSEFLVETVNGYDAADPKHPGFMDPGSYWRTWSILEPVRTQHTGESKGLVLPIMVPAEARADDDRVTSSLYPARTQTARHELGVAMAPFIVERRFDYRTRGTDEPLSTITAEDTTKALVFPPLMVPAGGTWNDNALSALAAARARTTRESEGVAYPPFVSELRGGGSVGHLASDPLATVAANGNHHALVMRMNEHRGDPASMTTPSTEPVRTMTTTGHQALLTGGTLDLNDIHFRMLEPVEIKQAMAFARDYILLGNRREQVKMSGNAVTPPSARDLVWTVAEAITGDVAA